MPTALYWRVYGQSIHFMRLYCTNRKTCMVHSLFVICQCTEIPLPIQIVDYAYESVKCYA